MANPDPIIEVEDLWKSFGEKEVLKGVTFSVYPGETVVIMGASGCGKSVLLRHIIGLHAASRGHIRLLGHDLTQISEDELNGLRKQFGVLFQSGAVYNSMSVADNIALPLREHTDLSEDLIRVIVRLKLELVGLRDAETLMPSELSGGMRKRVGLARAMAMDPQIMFYDEPSTGLDPIATSSIDEMILAFSKQLKVTSIAITHDMKSAFRIADRMILLEGGVVAAEGTPEEMRRSTNPSVKQFIEGMVEGPMALRMSSRSLEEDLIRI